jgi:hypothetical protein
MGAFLLIGDLLESEDFIKICRERAKLEMKRRTGKEPTVKLERDVAAVPPEKPRKTGSPLSEQVSADEEGERVVVRFKGPTGCLGPELRSLGLEYNRDQQRWSGTVVRREVIRAIEASKYAHLLESIEPAVPAKCDRRGVIDPAVNVSTGSTRPAAEPDFYVEFEVDMTEMDERSPAEIWRASILGAGGGTSR